MVTTPLLEKKSSTKYFDKGTNELADTPFPEKKSSTEDVDKGTDGFADIKKAVFTIHRKGYIILKVSIKDLQDGLNLMVG